MLVSVCIPCYRSSKTLDDVVQAIRDAFAGHNEYDYEVVLVNDNSPDNTWEVIERICEGDGKVTGVNLSRNYGQACARMAALKYAQGDAAVFMDDDGQHPAGAIFSLLEKIEEGYDVAYAKFKHKQHSLFKRVTSSLKTKISEALGNKPKGVTKSPFMAWSRVAMDAARDYDSPFPSVGSYLMCVTDKFVNVEVEHQKRIAGKSGYTLRKLFSLWLNGVTNFSIVPLRAASFAGMGFSAVGFVYGLYIIIRRLLGAYPSGYASTVAIQLFVGGVIMLILGIMGEYIGRMYMIMSQKPQYRVRSVVGRAQKETDDAAD